MAEYENCSDQVEQIITQSLCQPCEEKQITMVADIYCDTCGEFQCRECSKGHEMYKLLKGHKLTEVNQSTPPPSAVQVVDMKGIDMCVDHNKQFQYYCVDLDILLCSSCIVKNHGKYKHIQELDSEDIKSSAKPDQELKTMVSKLDDSAKTMLHDVHEAKQSIGQHLDGIHNMIDEKRDLIIQQFEELKVNVTTNISKKEQESDEKFDEMLARSTATVDKATIFRDILPIVLDHGTATQKYILQHVVSKLTADFHAYKDTHTVQPCTFSLEISPLLTGLLAPDHQLATLKSNLESIQETNGLTPTDEINPNLPAAETDDNTNLTRAVTKTELEEKATQTDIKETNSLSPNDQTNLQLPADETENKADLPRVIETKLEEKATQTDNTSPQLQPESAVKGPKQTVLQLLHTIGLQQEPEDRVVPIYTGMGFLPDGRLVAVDIFNNKLFIYSESMVILGTYNLRGQRNGLAVISENVVAVSDGDYKKIELFHISKENTFKVLRSLPTFAASDCISLMNETTILVSNYNATPSMRMISLTDGHEEHFANLRRKQYKIGNSKCTYVRSADMLALTDRNAHTVYLYTRNGNHLTCQAVKHTAIQEPAGICEGPNNTVMVCCWATHSLVQISTSGMVLATHKLSMPCPFTVCISADRQRLAVSNHYGITQLQVHQLHHV